MTRLWRRLLEEFGRAWCALHHSPYEMRLIVHQRLGIVSVCGVCRRVHP